MTANQLSVEEAGRLIFAEFAGNEASRLPKHVRLYDAIARNIEVGHFMPGQKLPGERELCSLIEISLGTVQRGLSQLVADGRIQREHGRGTFVRAGQLPLTDLWHYRFRDPKVNALLPVFANLAGRAQVLGDAAVRQALGDDRSGYVRICRLIQIENRFRCWSEMHLPFARFSGLLETEPSDIESVNLKQLLATRFDAPTLATTQTVKMHSFSADMAQTLGVKRRTSGLLLQVVGISRGAVPITFQRIYVPPSDCEMEIGADVVTSVAAAAA